MIYLISEDNFFAIGVMTTLNAAGIKVAHTTIEEFNNLNVISSDIVLLCAHSRSNSQALSQLIRETEGRVVYFVDALLDEHIVRLNSKGVIFKKTSKDELVKTIKNMLNGELHITSIYLSQKEVTIMNLLTQQKNVYSISKLLNISVKTVFTHKLSALHKLGLNRLNARSVLLYESVFQSRV